MKEAMTPEVQTGTPEQQEAPRNKVPAPKEKKQKIHRYFTYYPRQKELYVSGDGHVFLNKNDAHHHQQTLGTPEEVRVVKNPDL